MAENTNAPAATTAMGGGIPRGSGGSPRTGNHAEAAPTLDNVAKENSGTLAGPAASESDDQRPHAAGLEDPGRFLSPLPLSLLFLATSLTGSLVMMYALIIATAIPSITAAYNTIEDLDWYSTAYLFATCSVQPLVAKLYDLFRLKAVYIASVVLFEVGNLICALAPSSASFIGGRAVAGLGAAGLFTGGLIILTAAAPPKVRPLLIGMGMGLTIVGGVVGPLIGGAITEHLGWRWCMWIFLPPGGVSAIVFLLIRVPEQRKKFPVRTVLPKLHQSLDLIGFSLFAPSVVMLLLSLSWGGDRHAWNDPMIIGLLCGGSVLALLFCAWAWHKKEKALIPPDVIGKTVVYCGCTVAFLQVGAFATLGDYLPLWFQSVLEASPTNSGLMLLPTMITQLLATLFCGILFNKFGYAPVWAQTGNVLSAIGSGLLTTFNPSTGKGQWIGYQILVGVGRGFVIQIPPIVLQNHLPGEELATGTALLVFFQYFGSAVFLCISKTTFLNSLYGALATSAAGVDPKRVISTGATELRRLVPAQLYPAVIKAYSDALVTTFWLSAAASITAFFFSFGLGWKKVQIQTKKLMAGTKDETAVAAATVAGSPGLGSGTHESSASKAKESL